jgi:hypothetical protein
VSSGYLYLVTHHEHPGLLRVLTAQHQPAFQQVSGGSAIRYLVRCNDVETARLHLHTALRRRLVDIDNHLYRCDLTQAIAAVAAGDLRHRQVWIDPSLKAEELRRIASLTSLRRARQRRVDRIWRTVGGVGIALLLLHALVFF